MKPILALSVFALAALAIYSVFLYAPKLNTSSMQPTTAPYTTTSPVRYIPIGDSYTIGEGVVENERWPNVLVNRLNNEGIKIEVTSNPAVSGYTVADAIRFQVPVVENLRPEFVTVLIGANDVFGIQDVVRFKREYTALLDALQNALPDPKNMVLITIPDHTQAPISNMYPEQVEPQKKLVNEYNEFIKDIASQRGLPVADLYPVSQTMTSASDFTSDGLHPSAQGYEKWEAVIRPVVQQKLKQIAE